MYRLLFFAFFIACLSSTAQQWQWAYHLSTNKGSSAMITKPDAEGNCGIMGWCYNSDTSVFAGANGSFPIFERGSYVVKYDVLGNVKWISGGWGTSVQATDMNIDNYSNIFLTGDFGGKARFGIGADTLQKTVFPTGREYFFVKLDSNGKANFFQKGGGNCYNRGMSATVCSNNEVVVSLMDQTYCGQNGGVDTSYLKKYSNNGNEIWAVSPPSLQNYYSYVGFSSEQVTATKDAGFLVSGYWFGQPLNFYGVANSMSLAPSTSYNGSDADYFLAKYASSGNVMWAKAIRGKEMQGYQTVTVDNSNNIIMAMMSYDTCYFDNHVLPPLTDRTLHIIKTDSLGNLLNYISLPEPFQATCPGYFSLQDLKTDKNGNIYLLGIPDTSITIGGTKIHFSNHHSLALIKLDANFNYQWSQSAYQSNIAGSWQGSIAVTDEVVFIGISYNTPVFLSGSSYQFPAPKYSTTYDSFFACIKNGSVLTSVDDINEKEIKINIFPNPSTGIFNAHFSDNINTKITVRDILGNCLLKRNGQGSVQQIDLSSQPKGVYFLEAVSEKRRGYKKIIIQ